MALQINDRCCLTLFLAQAMFNLAGYQEKNLIYSGTRTLVYQAVRATDTRSVIVKVLRNPHPSFNELVQFRNQYVITRHLEHRTVVRPIALERYDNGYALVMPDSGAIALNNYWQNSSRNLAEFLSIGIQLSVALHYLSGQRIIHKDVKPANIIIHPESRQVQLIDFSIASLLPKEQQQLINPNVLEGTLAYISPEQTGRMNRGIDYRTDFYSLGVTFFELLAGSLPFVSSDPMELVHCHIAKMPPALGNGEWGIGNGELGIGNHRAIPEVIENIVLKLMAKNAEDRYQSALGLKQDLERCLQELEASGEISQFELGEKDRSDRFLIPEKLYGRSAEVQTLLAAFDRVAKGAKEMMLVAGFSGIGKTAVINEVHKPIVRQRGYFIKGKFDQFNRNIPFSALVEAFRDLMGQLLGESDTDLANWKAKILSALGDNVQVIIQVVPELELIVDKQPPVPELDGSAAQNRFNLLLQKFIAIFATPEHPLVLFVDDLQWVDSASLNIIKTLMGDRNLGYLFLLGAYRDNEVFPAHPLMLTLSEISKDQSLISTITLEPLSFHHINQLVAESLICSEDLAEPLTELVYQKTRGNPFFTTQFLVGLYQDELISFNLELGYWECDLVQVLDAALTNDVVEFMAGRLQKLPLATQKMLKLAACIGSQFDIEILATISQESEEEVAADIWNALQEGLILPITEVYKFFQGDPEETLANAVTASYRFLHDRVQQAAYSLIVEAEKADTHLKIGQLLFQGAPESEREEKLFAIASQLNKGRELLQDEGDRLELAELNLRAGRKAKAATAYSAALEYFKTGNELLPGNRWQQQYDLTLALSVGAAEAAYLEAEFEEMEGWGQEVLENATSLLDRVKVDKIKIKVFMAQNQPLQSVRTALDTLAGLGVHIPESPTPAEIQKVLTETQTLCESHSFEELSDLPVMTDPQKLAAIEILGLVVPPVTIAKPDLFPPIVCHQVMLSVQYGNSPFSAYAYANYGMMLCLQSNIELGDRFGQLALALLDRFNARELEAKVLMIFHSFIGLWKHHNLESIAGLLKAYRSALEVGDIEFAAHSSLIYCIYSFLVGSYLPELEIETSTYSEFCRKIKLEPIVVKDEILRQLVLNLIGVSEATHSLKGEVYDIETMIPVHQEAGDKTAVGLAYIWQLLLYYLFECFPEAVENAALAQGYLDKLPPTQLTPTFHFYSALAELAIYKGATESEREAILQRVASHQERMLYWARYAPMNFQHKHDLMVAEQYRVLGQAEAICLYDRAIAGAKENEYIQEEALANELAAKFYLQWSQEQVATDYMQKAYYCYARWGAKAKTDQLAEKYPQLLTPILNPSHLQTSSTSLGTVTTTASDLDLGSAIKASQALSEEIELDALLSKVMETVVENAGADAGSLILNDEGSWEIAAQCDRNECYLYTIPLELTNTIPSSIINTVKRTGETILINQLEKESSFITDPYFSQQQPQSLCCTPILNQGKLIGILYLENHLVPEAFTPDNLEVLNIISTQAAISIENARFYQTLENKVAKRTAELTAANAEITQLNEMLKDENQRVREEREKSERLLLNILPQAIAERLKEGQSHIADGFPEVTILFADIVGFTQLSETISPQDLVYLLNQIFSAFDALCARHGLEKIKTIGDAYMVVGGLPIPCKDHAEAIAEMALDMQQEIARFNAREKANLSTRIGINTGSIVAGVIGTSKFSYDLWGDAVNTASRMESHGIPGAIQVSATTYQLLQDKYLWKERGIIQVKGKGEMMAYLLLGRQPEEG